MTIIWAEGAYETGAKVSGYLFEGANKTPGGSGKGGARQTPPHGLNSGPGLREGTTASDAPGALYAAKICTPNARAAQLR